MSVNSSSNNSSSNNSPSITNNPCRHWPPAEEDDYRSTTKEGTRLRAIRIQLPIKTIQVSINCKAIRSSSMMVSSILTITTTISNNSNNSNSNNSSVYEGVVKITIITTIIITIITE